MCDQCNAVTITAGRTRAYVHGAGCPKAKDDYARRNGCAWCGQPIGQDNGLVSNGKAFCDGQCYEDYNL
jgi:hypothetical protein